MPKYQRKKFYAVAKGQEPGVYPTWEECQKQVRGFAGAVFQGFNTKIEAETFLQKKADAKPKSTSLTKYHSLDPYFRPELKKTSKTLIENPQSSIQDSCPIPLTKSSPLSDLKSTFPRNTLVKNPQKLAPSVPIKKEKMDDFDFYNTKDIIWSDEEDWEPSSKQRYLDTLAFHDPHALNKKPKPLLIDGIKLSEEQQRVLNLVLNSGESTFFTGSAGTGKSILLQKIIHGLKQMHGSENVAVTATTGIAAVNVSGITLHSFAGIGHGVGQQAELLRKIKRTPIVRKRWQDVKVLIIDEVSMLDADLFDKLEGIARDIRKNEKPFGNIQLVITGDFFQLPPVSKDGNAKFCFEAKSWGRVVKHTVQLTQIFRQKDSALIVMLNELRYGKLSDKSWNLVDRLKAAPEYPDDGIKPTELFARNDSVANANKTRLDQLPSKCHTYIAQDCEPGRQGQLETLKKSCLAYEVLELKKDAQVMLIKNISKDLVNGSRGVVIGFADMQKCKNYYEGEDENVKTTANLYPIVKFTNGIEEIIQEAEWKLEGPGEVVLAVRRQIPLVPAWAISIHKSQGQTLERVKVDLGRVFEKGQAYVALSRATSARTLQVLNFNQDKVMVHPKVKQFYESLTDASNNE